MAHDTRSTRTYARAAWLGVVAGMRTQLPLALLALAARRGQFAVDSGAPMSLLRSPMALKVLALLAGGELIADKLPSTPSRLSHGPLFGRLLFGSLTGAAVAAEARWSPALGAVLGAGGAVLGAESGYHARAFLDRATNVPDPVWGAVEDATAITLGLIVTRPRQTP